MKSYKIGIIGLGYVGFPLACLFAKKYPTIGYDPQEKRIAQLREGIDITNEIDTEVIQARLNTYLQCTNDPNALKDCNVYIVAVPTPIDLYQQPDLTALRKASKTVGTLLKQGDIVIYESTVYPGVTEEVCVPILEQTAKLTFNSDFFVGYSPERVNPSDKQHTVENIKKITLATPMLMQDLEEVLYNNYDDVIKHLLPERQDYQSSQDDKLRIVRKAAIAFVKQIEVELPKPNNLSVLRKKEAFSDYIDAVNTAVEYYISSEIQDPEMLGELANIVEPVKKMIVAKMARDWMVENDYLPELNDLISQDEEGKPTFDIYEITADFSSNIIKSLGKFYDKAKVMKKLSDMYAKDNDIADDGGFGGSSSYDSGSSDDSSSGDDFGMDDLGGDMGLPDMGDMEEGPSDDQV